MPLIQYAFRDDAKNITLLTQGSTAACPLCQIVVLRKREFSPDFLDQFMAMDIKTPSFPASAISEYGREIQHTQDNHRYYAVIDSQIEFTVKPRTMQKLSEFMPAYTGIGLYNFFEGQPYGYLVVLKVYISSERIPDSLMEKGRMGSSQIIQLYDQFGEKTQIQIPDNLQPLVDLGIFENIKYEILHTLRVENALIGVYGNDDNSKRLLKEKRDIYNDNSPKYKHTFNEEENIDRSQVDYEETYRRVVELAPSMSEFIEYVRNIKPPQMAECREMFQRMIDGDQNAKHRIVEMYLRNIIRMSLPFAEKYHLPIEDIIQEGVIGMMNAIEKFDISGDEYFQQYFPLWVRQVIQRELPQYLYIRHIPMHFHEKLLEIKDIAATHGYNNLPEDFNIIDSNAFADISSKLGISSSEIYKYIQYMTPELSLEEMFEINPEVDEYEASLNEDPMLDLVEYLHWQQVREALDAVFHTLTPREMMVIRLRHGFDDGKIRTFEEVGKEFNVTRERIRQIEAKAIRKLRHPSRAKYLKDFLD